MLKRIVRLVVALAGISIMVFAVPLGVGVANYLIANRYNELDRLADQVSLSVGGDLSWSTPPQPAGAAEQIGIYDQTGSKTAGSGPDVAVPLVVQALGGGAGRATIDGRMAVAAPVSDGDAIVGVVLVTADRSPVDRQIGFTWSLMAALAAAAVLIAWLLARRQARKLVEPLGALTDAAARLGAGDFTVRTSAVGISEIDLVGESVNRTAGQLGELIARERAFSSDVSHQLRTPVTGLRLLLESALDEPDADLRGTIIDALATTDRLQVTIDELLALAGNVPRPADPIDIDALMIEVRAHWHARLAAQGRPLRMRVTDGAQARGSGSSLLQILDVLIENAQVHGAGAITVTVRTLDSAVAVDVTDEGVALTDSDTQLFHGRSTQGSPHGIGLGLARRLAEAQGGRLRLASADPPTFTLLLPDALPPEHGDRIGQPAVRPTSEPLPRK